MLLLDTNVLVALVDERDGLHARARRDLKRLKGPFGATSATLCEACFLLPASYLRERLRFILNRLPVHLVGLEPALRDEVFGWLKRYAEHQPDWCDAELVVLASGNMASIWTYEMRNFRATWRGCDGSRLQVVPKALSSGRG